MNEENIVENWLKSLHLGQYAQSFIDNGYDDLEICKQIGEPDLDAIGVSDATHRQQILRAVRVLLEHGGTAVYFTLEENARHGLDPVESVKEALAKEKEAIRAAHSPAKKYLDEYEEGKAEFVRFPKMQLKMIIRDKLVRDGIRLSTQPYTNPDGSRGHLESLAGLYAEELRTHYRDVIDRLEELRKRRVAIDFPPLPLDSDNLGLKVPHNFKPGKYSPSSCLSDHEEDNIYSLYQCPYAATCSRTQRCLSPRSRYFYEPCPFPAEGGKEESSEHIKKRGGLGKLFRSLGSKKDKPSNKPGKPHLLHLTQKPHAKIPRLPPGNVLLGDEERLQLMLLVRDGFLTMEQAVQKIRHREAERSKEKSLQQPGKNEVITEFGKRVFWSPPGSKRRQPRSTAVFYPEMTTTCVGNHIYYEPPDDLDWEVEDIVESKPAEVRSDLRPYTPEEFTSAILARSCAAGEGEGVATSTTTNQTSGALPTACCGPSTREESKIAECDYTSSPVMGRRCKGNIVGRLKNMTNRTSYSTSEEGHSQSSDYEEQEDNDNKLELQSREVQSRSSSSSWAGRVRDLHRDVKRRISRLRSTRGSTPDNEVSQENAESHEAVIRPGSSVESIPSGSGSHSSLQAPTPTSSNRSSTSAGEDDGTPFIGPLIGRARAIVDYTPSPYDKDALAFKKGDIIDIIAKNKTGIWVGMAHGRVGHFKFINVEELPCEGKTRRRHRHSSEKPLISNKPESLHDLLKQLDLQDYMNVFVLNGYEDLDTLKEIEKEDLDSLGIHNPDHSQKLLRAIELLQDYDGDAQTQDGEYQEENQKSSPRDSGCYASNENLIHKETVLPQNWLTTTENEDNEVSQSESGIQSSEGPESGAMINNLDSNSISGECNSSTFLISNETPSSNEHVEGGLPMTNYNIPPHFSFDTPVSYEQEVNIPARNQDSVLCSERDKIYDKRHSSRSAGASVTYGSGRNSDSAFSEYFKMNGRSERVLSEPNCKVSHLLSSHSSLANSILHSRIESGENYRDIYCSHSKNSIIYSRQTSESLSMDIFTKNSKSASLPRNKSQNSDSSNNPPVQKHSFFESKKSKKSNQRKASLQPVARSPCPPPLSILLAVTDKLEEECIDLCEEPYTDKMGFCGIPPALVQRYAEELHQDVYDVAQALDQTRTNALQMRGHRAVPNDFLGDSCLDPVLEANYNSVTDWLVSLGLPMYDNLLKLAGYNHLSRVATIRTTDLQDCGITNAQHIRLLTSAISVLHLHANPSEQRYNSSE